MPYGSDKQLAYFKRQAEKFKLCEPCEAGPDLFENEALKRRMERHLAGLKAIRARRALRKYVKGADARARQAGFKSHEARLATGWFPGKPKGKLKITSGDKAKKFGHGFKEEDTFTKQRRFKAGILG